MGNEVSFATWWCLIVWSTCVCVRVTEILFSSFLLLCSFSLSLFCFLSKFPWGPSFTKSRMLCPSSSCGAGRCGDGEIEMGEERDEQIEMGQARKRKIDGHRCLVLRIGASCVRYYANSTRIFLHPCWVFSHDSFQRHWSFTIVFFQAKGRKRTWLCCTFRGFPFLLVRWQYWINGCCFGTLILVSPSTSSLSGYSLKWTGMGHFGVSGEMTIWGW